MASIHHGPNHRPRPGEWRDLDDACLAAFQERGLVTRPSDWQRSDHRPRPDSVCRLRLDDGTRLVYDVRTRTLTDLTAEAPRG